MIKAIIFDCFGVLVKPSLEPFLDKYFPNSRLRQEAIDLDKRSARGELSWDQYAEAIGKLAGITPQEVWNELDNNPPNIELFDYIRTRLLGKYKIGFLSNAAADWMDDLFTKEQQSYFDDVVLSYRTGLAKPDERIFELSASNLEVLPEECIFVDDIERYCVGARDTGMKAVRYKNFAEFERDLEKLLQ